VLELLNSEKFSSRKYNYFKTRIVCSSRIMFFSKWKIFAFLIEFQKETSILASRCELERNIAEADLKLFFILVVYLFVFEAFIFLKHTTTMHIKFWQQHCNVLRPKNLTPWRDSNPGSSVLEADAMTTMYIYHATTATFPYSFPKWYFKRFLYCASTQLTCVVVLIVVVRLHVTLGICIWLNVIHWAQ
jgi:hypothetical protein